MTALNQRFVRILGISVAVILMLDVVALAGWSEVHAHRPSWASQHALVAGPKGLPVLERFVEHARGLRFKEPVNVELVDRQQLNDARHTEEDLANSNSTSALHATSRPDVGSVLGVMGLVPKGANVSGAVDNAEDNGVAGVYFPRQKRLLVIGQEQTPFVREVLVHELTHALDDQYFDIGRRDIGLHDDEELDSWRALNEGDATSVEKKYLDAMSPADRQSALAAQSALAGGGPPTVIDDLLSYPYVAGLRFVEKLRDSGGNKAVNAAFRHPPTTSEQILRPDHFLTLDTPTIVTKPTPRGTPVGRGVFGVLQLGELLSTVADGPAIRDALDGWNGDRFVAWTEPSGATCLDINVANDSPTAAGKLAAAFQTWLAHNPTGSVNVAGDVVKLERCA
ncbi:MAG TPA: hypothetical protein VHD87_08990 [Acidimicrobiales bacterium]|nr:hypothetical protein [Acidimicrobiales bacterium]